MADMEKNVMVRLCDVFELCIEGNFIAEIMYVLCDGREVCSSLLYNGGIL